MGEGLAKSVCVCVCLLFREKESERKRESESRWLVPESDNFTAMDRKTHVTWVRSRKARGLDEFCVSLCQSSSQGLL